MAPPSRSPSPFSREIRKSIAASVPVQPVPAANPFGSPSSSESSSISNGKEGHNEHNEHTTAANTGQPPTLMHYFKEEVTPTHASLFLIISFFTSGLIDSVAFNAWSCFVGMQTGNTVFAALGISSQPHTVHPNAYLKSITSIVAFCCGTLFFSAFHRLPCWSDPNPLPSRRRMILIGSFSIQTIFILTAAVLIRFGLVSNRPAVAGAFSSGNHLSSLPNPEEEDNYKDLIAIALLAFQSSGPVFFSRVLGQIELPTIVLSTLYCDFTADLYRLPYSLRNMSSWHSFFFIDERRQFRRLGCILSLFLGGLTGGMMFRSNAGMIGAIWLAAGLKGSMVALWVVWKSEKKAQGHGEV